MLLLLRTFIDIIILRKGPESVPSSWLVFVVALAFMVASSFAAIVMIDDESGQSYALTYFAYGLGILFYAAVIYLSGHVRRVLQSITSIIACGSIITILFVAAIVLLTPLVGRELAAIVATLMLFWSVPVEGHIIAKAIGQHWYIGIGVAMTAFVLQYGVQSAFGPAR